jgi:hypothetical protein
MMPTRQARALLPPRPATAARTPEGAGNPDLRLSRCGFVLVDEAAEQVSAPHTVENDDGL